MTEHHKDASPGIAKAVYENLDSEQRAAVEKEASERGVEPIEIVRRSLDVLISETGQADGKSVFVRRSGS
ncbi:hypothetical protein [Methylobacterium sp. AMS5]|uniref:hypothetical protein n=1 Tax=Methylobacterium sp. AMS5 TaxID=925818 RepID=UPI00074F9B13|nr:hypothetical protein [Methylobacterium sp. AMS5]AMB43369.1 hypothetical protein Y590_00540 [Methylobacterium sp. AMS5]